MNYLPADFELEKLRVLSYETPFFLFSRKALIENYKKFSNFFPKAQIHYAIKANSHSEILEILNKEGCGFEVASVYELNMLKKIKVSPSKIIYGTSVKPHSHIKEFFEYGVDRFAADSVSELEKIAAKAPHTKIYIRAIVNDSSSVFKFSEKFGTDMNNIVPLLEHAKELGLKPYGISFHVGSQAGDPMAWAHAIQKLRPIVKELSEKGIKIELLNLGGGYPCRYASSENVPDLEDISKNIYKEYKKLSHQPMLLLEPGRGMVANTGVLIVSVIARIERAGSTWLFLDAGVYNGLFETMAYQGSTRYAVASLRPPGGAGESMFALAGPTGDSPDVISREALLPQDIEVGDKLVFYNTGAYSLSVTSEFNGFPKPKVYMV